MQADRPRVIGRYALYDQIGVGGMGSVSVGVAREGDAPTTASVIAAKQVLGSHENDPKRVAMLLDEMRLTRLAQHPNVVAVRDLVYDGDQMVLVMDYVHGESLRRLLAASRQRGARVPARIAGAIVRDVLLGLAAAHGAGIVHRDVTPENILVGASGEVKLTDFGVAKADGRFASTNAGSIKGKLAYLAPEQVGGDVSSRTDLYAAALVLWEALAGRRAIVGSNEAEIIVKVLSPEIPRVREIAADVPAALDDVIARGLAVAAADRYESAEELARAIEAAAGPLATQAEVAAWAVDLAGEALAARGRRIDEILAAERARAWPATTSTEATVTATIRTVPPRRWSLALVGVAVAVVAVSSAIVGAVVSARDSSAAPPVVPAQAALPPPAPLEAPTASASPEPAPPETSEPPVKPASAPARPSKRRAPSRARAGCETPFVIDSAGIVVYKNECLK